MDKKFGDSFKTLPTDSSQELPPYELQFIEGKRSSNVPSAKKDKIAPKLIEEFNESDEESDTEEEADEPVEQHRTSNLWNDLKVTLIASVLFILLTNDFVDGGLRKIGVDGIKLLFIKTFIFAILLFIIRYKFS